MEINSIGTDMKSNIDIDKSRLDIIAYDEKDDCLIGFKCNNCKQWELVKGIKRDR